MTSPSAWLDAPTREGLWWLRSEGVIQPVRVHTLWRDRDDGTLRFGVSYIGTEDTTNEHDTPGQWRPLDAPGLEPGESPPLSLRAEFLCPVDSFAAPPGNPGARVIRTG